MADVHIYVCTHKIQDHKSAHIVDRDMNITYRNRQRTCKAQAQTHTQVAQRGSDVLDLEASPIKVLRTTWCWACSRVC